MRATMALAVGACLLLLLGAGCHRVRTVRLERFEILSEPEGDVALLRDLKNNREYLMNPHWIIELVPRGQAQLGGPLVATMETANATNWFITQEPVNTKFWHLVPATNALIFPPATNVVTGTNAAVVPRDWWMAPGQPFVMVHGLVTNYVNGSKHVSIRVSAQGHTNDFAVWHESWEDDYQKSVADKSALENPSGNR